MAKIDNILKNGAEPHDFAGAARELRGELTGFDHVTEMRNSVRGLRLALASIRASLANPHIPEFFTLTKNFVFGMLPVKKNE